MNLSLHSRDPNKSIHKTIEMFLFVWVQGRAEPTLWTVPPPCPIAPITSHSIQYKSDSFLSVLGRIQADAAARAAGCLLAWMKQQYPLNLAGLQMPHGPTGDGLIDLAQRRYRYLRCQLMSCVCSSVR